MLRSVVLAFWLCFRLLHSCYFLSFFSLFQLRSSTSSFSSLVLLPPVLLFIWFLLVSFLHLFHCPFHFSFPKCYRYCAFVSNRCCCCCFYSCIFFSLHFNSSSRFLSLLLSVCLSFSLCDVCIFALVLVLFSFFSENR